MTQEDGTAAGADLLAPEVAEAIVRRTAGARRFAALTGSGVSAESGIPTFREAQTGLWARFQPEELATPEAFAEDPARVWAWYRWRRSLVGAAEPNSGHFALAELESRVPAFTLITQNVDGLHQAAGSRRVVEFHGSLRQARCADDGNHPRIALGLPDGDGDADQPPRCTRCGALMRPDVVWFGEAIPTVALATAVDAVQRCDVLICAGTSARVHPAASLADVAREHGGCVIEVNLEATPASDRADYALQGESGKLLPALVGLLAASAES